MVKLHFMDLSCRRQEYLVVNEFFEDKINVLR